MVVKRWCHGGNSKGKEIQGALKKKKVENMGKYIGNDWGLEDDGQLAMKLMWRERRAELKESIGGLYKWKVVCSLKQPWCMHNRKGN